MKLIHEFRASMVLAVYRFSCRLMMLALTPDVFRTILEDFWAHEPPRQYSASEAEAFIAYCTLSANSDFQTIVLDYCLTREHNPPISLSEEQFLPRGRKCALPEAMGSRTGSRFAHPAIPDVLSTTRE